jgi:uncharacterized protein
MVEKSTQLIIQDYIDELNKDGIIVDKIVLFGSYKKGSYDEYSDIDIIVVSPVFDESFTRDDIVKLWKAAARVDSRIEPVHCGVRQWEYDDSSVILEIARREGTAVNAA